MTTRRLHRTEWPGPPDTETATAPYLDLADRRLAAVLAAEDVAEETSALSPHERITCHLHRRWAHQCISSPQHVIPVTGHRWCRRCQIALSVAVDELDGSVRLTCPRCLAFPNITANQQIVRACRASLAAAQHRADDTLRLLSATPAPETVAANPKAA